MRWSAKGDALSSIGNRKAFAASHSRRVPVPIALSIAVGNIGVRIDRIGYFLEYSEGLVDDEASLTAVHVRLGAHINDYFSGEARLGAGDGTVEGYGLDADVPPGATVMGVPAR